MPVSGLDPQHLAEGSIHGMNSGRVWTGSLTNQSGDKGRDNGTFPLALEPAHLAVRRNALIARAICEQGSSRRERGGEMERSQSFKSEGPEGIQMQWSKKVKD